MTHLTVRNLGPGMRSLKDIHQRNINLRPGDSKSIDVHAIHASMLLKEAHRKTPQFEVQITADERVAMEQEVQAADTYRGAPGAFPNAMPQGVPKEILERAKALTQPVETTKVRINETNDPKQQVKQPVVKDPATDEAKTKKTRTRPTTPKRQPRERKRPAKRTED